MKPENNKVIQMNEKTSQEWITPELVEYGDVATLTAIEYKTHGTGDQLTNQLSPWQSGCPC